MYTYYSGAYTTRKDHEFSFSGLLYKKGGGSLDGALLRYGVQMILIVTK